MSFLTYSSKTGQWYFKGGMADKKYENETQHAFQVEGRALGGLPETEFILKEGNKTTDRLT